MAYDVFISHSSIDKTIADAVCAKLEQKGIRCWIAPRDILPGKDWTSAITAAIVECRTMVLVFSQHADRSSQVPREVGLAMAKSRIIVPFRVDDTQPTGSLEYCLGNTHWLDAMTPPLEKHLDRLIETIGRLLDSQPLQTTLPAPSAAQAIASVNLPITSEKNQNPQLNPLLRLRVLTGAHAGETFPLGFTRIVVGRSPAVDIVLPGEISLSRSHFALNWDSLQRGYVFVDFAAANPTEINGVFGSTGTLMKPGDILSLGATTMILEKNS